MKNVILITIDALRADSLGCMGYDKNVSPIIDKLSKNGIVFTNAFATGSSTSCSFPGILASRFYSRKQLNITLASELQKNNYATAAFHSNPFLSKYCGYDKGFSVYDDSIKKPIEKKKIYKEILEIFTRLKVYKSFIHFIYNFKKPYVTANKLTEKAIKWIKNSNKKFFLWIHYMDVHNPYFANNAYLKKIGCKRISFFKNKKLSKAIAQNNISENKVQLLKNIYDAEIRFIDDQIKILLDMLTKKNLDKNTYIIITADHGEEFYEHNGLTHDAKLYDELLNIPLIINGPNIEKKKENKLISLIDLPPTILDLVGVSSPKEFEGKSIFKNERDFTIAERRHKKADFLDFSDNDWLIAMRTKKWKFILDKYRGKKELYNLEKDPKEQNNIYNEKNDMAKLFEEKINEHIQKSRTFKKEKIKKKDRKPLEKEDEEKVKARLKALGYM